METQEILKSYHFEVIKSPVPYPAQESHEVVEELRDQIGSQFEAQGGTSLLPGPIKMDVVYTFPQAHSFRLAKRRGEPVLPSGTRSPTLYKLDQVVLEALSGKVFHQKSQVVESSYDKKYGHVGRYDIDVAPIKDEVAGALEARPASLPFVACTMEREPIPLPTHGGRTFIHELREAMTEKLQSQLSSSPLGGPCALSVIHRIPRPHSSHCHVRQNEDTFPTGVRSPDLDDLTEVVAMALSAGVLHHEGQLVHIDSRKEFSPKGEYQIRLAPLHVRPASVAHSDSSLSLSSAAPQPLSGGEELEEEELRRIEEQARGG